MGLKKVLRQDRPIPKSKRVAVRRVDDVKVTVARNNLITNADTWRGKRWKGSGEKEWKVGRLHPRRYGVGSTVNY